MRPGWKQLLIVLAVLVFVYVIALPVVMGGFSYGAGETSRAALQASVHRNHAGFMPAMGQGFRWAGQAAPLSGLIPLAALVLVVLGSTWLLVGRVSRHDQKSN